MAPSVFHNIRTVRILILVGTLCAKNSESSHVKNFPEFYSEFENVHPRDSRNTRTKNRQQVAQSQDGEVDTYDTFMDYDQEDAIESQAKLAPAVEAEKQKSLPMISSWYSIDRHVNWKWGKNPTIHNLSLKLDMYGYGGCKIPPVDPTRLSKARHTSEVVRFYTDVLQTSCVEDKVKWLNKLFSKKYLGINSDYSLAIPSYCPLL